MRVRPFVSALFIVTLLCPGAVQASWLSEITGINVDLNRGRVEVKPPNLAAIPKMVESLPKDIGQALLNPASTGLAAAIRLSRGQALNDGVQPVPEKVRAALASYFPPGTVERVRWTTTSGGRVGLDTVLSQWFGQEGAVTLDDVIVFSDARLASGNTQASLELWAHELTHTIQYSNLGVETFAFNYSVNFGEMEQQARDNAALISRSLANKGSYERSFASVSPSQVLTWSQVNSAARDAIDPRTCIWINGYTTGNACPIVVAVTGVVMTNGYMQQIVPCNEPTCVFQPNQFGPLLSPPGWKIIGVTAAYRVG